MLAPVFIMRFLKIENQDGRTVLVQISNITSIWQSGENTIISMIDPNDCITIKVPIEQVEKTIHAYSQGSIISLR